MRTQTRRRFLQSGLAVGGGTISASLLASPSAMAVESPKPKMQFGLVTYLWGKDFKLPELIDVCEQSGVMGLELRTEHAHGVEPSLSKAERKQVRQRFADSPVELVGYGSNAQYHEEDPAKVRENIELTKRYIELMHDCGATGVKVKPNGFPKNIAKEKTIEQIGRSLNEVAAFGKDHGQQIRVEVHGRGTSELPVIRDIFQIADHPNATVCWNSNDVDLNGEGLEHNFELVKDRFGSTVHVRELNVGDYPYAKLMKLFVAMNYDGWILLEARTNPKDKVQALMEQRKLFETMTNA